MHNSVIAYLKKNNVRYATNEEGNIVSFSSKMTNAFFECVIEWNDRLQIVLFYTNFAPVIPENKRLVISELISRINYGLIIGCYEIDFNDGEVRFRSSVDVEGIDFQEGIIKNLLDANLAVSNVYFPALIEAMNSDLPPSEILDKIEKSRQNLT